MNRQPAIGATQERDKSDSTFLIAPLSFGDGQRCSVGRQAPVVKFRKNVFQLKDLLAWAAQRIKGKKDDIIPMVNAVEADRSFSLTPSRRSSRARKSSSYVPKRRARTSAVEDPLMFPTCSEFSPLARLPMSASPCHLSL